MHIFGLIDSVYKGDKTTVTVVGQGKSGLFKGLAEDAVLGTLFILKLAAYTYPLVVINIVFLLYAVQHQVFIAALDLTKSYIFHLISLKYSNIHR